MKLHPRTFTAFLLLSTLFAALLVAACGSGGGSKTEARITVSGGGELRSEDGSFVLSVPPNAVSEDVTISLEEISPEDADDGILNAEGPRFELQPDGMQFSEPARVTLTVPVENLDTGAENDELPTFNLISVSSEGDISGLENLDNSFDLESNELSISADVPHFSSIVRTKRNFTVKLTRITGGLALGEPRVIDAEVDANTPSVNHSLDWRLEALSNVRLDPSVTRAVQVNQVQRDVQFTSDSARATDDGTLLESESFNNLSVSTNLICTGLGTGIYSFSMTATPMREGITAVNLRPVRISITASVTCIGVAEAAATARTSIDETVRAGGADLVFTPTPFPIEPLPWVRLESKKGDISVTLDELKDAVIVGDEAREIHAFVINNSRTVNYTATWELTALSNVAFDEFSTDVFQIHTQEDGTLEVSRRYDGDSSELDGSSTVDQQYRDLTIRTGIVCIEPGPGLYSLSVLATPRPETEAAASAVPLEFSLLARVTCVAGIDGAATPPAASIPTATPRATPVPTTGPVPTATPRPTQTPLPTQGPKTGDIQLRVIAASGDIAPGPDLDSFTSFELPQAGGEGGIFYAFNQSGATGIWSFEPTSGDIRLTPVVTTTSPPEDFSFVFVNSESFMANQSGSVVYIGRWRSENDFTEGVYKVSEQAATEVMLEGAPVPDGFDDEEFRQFDTVQVTESGHVLFESPATGHGFWFSGNFGTTRVVTEGEELTDLREGWRDTGSGRMRSAGVTDAGTMLLFVPDYRNDQGGVGEERGSGIWVIPAIGDHLVARTGMQAPDLTTFTDFLDPSMNPSEQVAFRATSQIEIGSQLSFNNAIWKWDLLGGLTKIAEEATRVGPDQVELVDVTLPIIQPDGRVVFVGTAFDNTGSLISFLLKGDGTNIEVLARTDALPGPNGPVSVVPNTIGQITTNSHGAVVFQAGFLGDVWLRSPDGSFDRIIGAGDMLSVESAGGTVQKTVSFVEFVGGAATDMGLPTGFSDDFDMVMKVTFFDGTEAVVQATVFDELFDNLD